MLYSKKIISILLLAIFVSCCYKNTNSNIDKSTSYSKIRYLQSISSLVNFDKIKLTDEHNDTIIFDAFSKTKTIFFYFNEINCLSCVNKEIKKINAFNNKHTDIKIIIIAKYRRLRDLYVFKRINQIKEPVYKIASPLPIPLCELNVPFYFVIKNNNTSFVYCPDKNTDFTENYLIHLYKYFNNNKTQMQ